MNVVWVAIVTGVLAKQCYLQMWMSVLLAVAGVGIMELEGSAAPVYGDLWLLLQPICFGTGFLLLESVMKSFPDTPTFVCGVELTTIALCCFLWTICEGYGVEQYVALLSSPSALLGLVYMGLVTTAGGLWLQSITFKRIQAADAAIITATEPLWASMFAWLFLGESLSPSDLFGGLFIIAACLINEFKLVENCSKGRLEVLKV